MAPPRKPGSKPRKPIRKKVPPGPDPWTRYAKRPFDIGMKARVRLLKEHTPAVGPKLRLLPGRLGVVLAYRHDARGHRYYIVRWEELQEPQEHPRRDIEAV